MSAAQKAKAKIKLVLEDGVLVRVEGEKPAPPTPDIDEMIGKNRIKFTTVVVNDHESPGRT